MCLMSREIIASNVLGYYKLSQAQSVSLYDKLIRFILVTYQISSKSFSEAQAII